MVISKMEEMVVVIQEQDGLLRVGVVVKAVMDVIVGVLVQVEVDKVRVVPQVETVVVMAVLLDWDQMDQEE